jgi:ribose 5-phosphate isomerase B
VATIDEAELQRIVQRVLSQAMGLSQPGGLMPPERNAASTKLAAQPATAGAPAPASAAPAAQPASRAASPAGPKVVAIGSDHGGYDLKEILKAYLAELGFDVRDAGAYNKGPVDYPDFAHEVARLVSAGKAWRGIMIDGAGIGSCIVANKVPGIRAGMAYDYSSAVNSREHNDTNVLTLGAGLIGVNLAKQIVKVWLSTDFGGGRHQPRIDKITAVEKQYLK